MTKKEITIPSIDVSTKVVGELKLTDFVMQEIDDTATIAAISAGLENTTSHCINNASLLKPISEHPLNLSIALFDAPEMSDMIGRTFDSCDPTCSSYIEALLINNALGVDGTQWMKPQYVSGDFGFGVEYNNAPVVVHVHDWMMSDPDLSVIASNFREGLQLYLRTEWYYELSGEIHKSDCYSQVLPSFAEQTALNPRAPSTLPTACGIEEVKEIEYTDVSSAPGTGDFYLVKPNQINVLENGLDGDEFCQIYLDNYSEGNLYKVKFDALSSIELDNNGGTFKIAGNSTYLPEFEDYGLEFEAGKTYFVQIQAGMVQVLASKNT